MRSFGAWMQRRCRLVSLVSGQRRVAVAWMQRRSRLVSLAYSRVGVAPGRGGRYRPEASPWRRVVAAWGKRGTAITCGQCQTAVASGRCRGLRVAVARGAAPKLVNVESPWRPGLPHGWRKSWKGIISCHMYYHVTVILFLVPSTKFCFTMYR